MDLFDVDGDGQPRGVVKSLVPAQGNFSFFEVSPVSFHQVSEVTVDPEAVEESTGQNRVRLSVSGWYHGSPIVRPEPPPHVQMDLQPLAMAADTNFSLEQWLAPEYLKAKNIAKIAAQFQQESSIELAAFINKDKYATLMHTLQTAPEEAWKHVGPANKQNYSTFANIERVKTTAAASSSSAAAAASSSSSSSVSASSASAFLSSLHSFLTSVVFGAYLGRLTGLEYLSAGGCVRRFRPGCYTLAHSDDPERFEEAVDINLCAINQPPPGLAAKKLRWDAATFGGSTHYIEVSVAHTATRRAAAATHATERSAPLWHPKFAARYTHMHSVRVEQCDRLLTFSLCCCWLLVAALCCVAVCRRVSKMS